MAPSRVTATFLRGVRRLPPSVLLSLGWILLIVILAVFAGVLPIKGDALIIGNSAVPPGFRWSEPFGTDTLGRSVLSRIIFGARASLSVSLLAVIFGMAIGGFIGMVAGFWRGLVDGVVSMVVEAILAIPALILLLALSSIRGPAGQNFTILIGGLAVISVPTFARLARAQTLMQMQRDYIMAARALGMSRLRIICSEILPNIVPSLLSYGLVISALLIVVEGSLSFIGIGIPPPTPSWGGMISDGTQRMTQDPSLVIIPALVLAITVLSFNTVGSYVRRRVEIDVA